MRPVWRRWLIILVGLCVALFVFSTESKVPDENVAIRINNRTISGCEFRHSLECEAYADPEADASGETCDKFIDYLIRKELLIQEAVRLKLDREEKFAHTIQKYWEATLIRSLLEEKSLELKDPALIEDWCCTLRRSADIHINPSVVEDAVRSSKKE